GDTLGCLGDCRRRSLAGELPSGARRVQDRAQNSFEIRMIRRAFMKRRSPWEAMLAIAIIAIAGEISLHAELTEELHKTYRIDADGRVSLKNVNGAVSITGWDRNEVQVDAVKRARTKEALDEASIVIDSASGSISIRTRYPEAEQRRSWKGRESASVEYTLKVPRGARLSAIGTVNGAVTVKDVAGSVKASTVNGAVTAQNLANEAQLSTVNGPVEATFHKLEGTPSISLHTVNGNISLTIPDKANADLNASTVHGGIAGDLGMPIWPGAKIGKSFSAQIGKGGARIRLNSVNGGIRILSTSGGRRVLHT